MITTITITTTSEAETSVKSDTLHMMYKHFRQAIAQISRHELDGQPARRMQRTYM